MNFVIFLCVGLKLFSLSFVPLLAPNPGDATGWKWFVVTTRSFIATVCAKISVLSYRLESYTRDTHYINLHNSLYKKLACLKGLLVQVFFTEIMELCSTQICTRNCMCLHQNLTQETFSSSCTNFLTVCHGHYSSFDVKLFSSSCCYFDSFLMIN